MREEVSEMWILTVKTVIMEKKIHVIPATDVLSSLSGHGCYWLRIFVGFVFGTQL